MSKQEFPFTVIVCVDGCYCAHKIWARDESEACEKSLSTAVLEDFSHRRIVDESDEDLVERISSDYGVYAVASVKGHKEICV